ncbi:hypothetical protein ACIRYZ_08100 [Kitasatospora sp. NPDC101155]|uniref:hypothetical protein n=1 Tax=Kitasatospora sp. NPDC101155 TaxID=3364097 RepID=UPI0038283F5D
MTTTLSPPSESPQVRSRWGLFAQRDFRLLWAGQTVSRLGSSITSIALPLVAVLYLVGLLFVVAAVVFVNIVLASFRQSYTPPALLSRVSATLMFPNHATIPLGALAGGELGAVIGLRATMWVMTGLLALCGALPLLSPLRTVRELPTTPPQPGEIIG